MQQRVVPVRQDLIQRSGTGCGRRPGRGKTTPRSERPRNSRANVSRDLAVTCPVQGAAHHRGAIPPHRVHHSQLPRLQWLWVDRFLSRPGMPPTAGVEELRQEESAPAHRALQHHSRMVGNRTPSMAPQTSKTVTPRQTVTSNHLRKLSKIAVPSPRRRLRPCVCALRSAVRLPTHVAAIVTTMSMRSKRVSASFETRRRRPALKRVSSPYRAQPCQPRHPR